jgi:hypothetical protein
MDLVPSRATCARGRIPILNKLRIRSLAKKTDGMQKENDDFQVRTTRDYTAPGKPKSQCDISVAMRNHSPLLRIVK